MSALSDIIIVGNESDNISSYDVSFFFGQRVEIGDLISLKTFENTEFCPRFISAGADEAVDPSVMGRSLEGKTVIIVSTSTPRLSRNDVAMRNMLVARAAKDNGAAWVALLEPELFYSAQDRGPRPEHGDPDVARDAADLAKFNGQPFSAQLYAQLLKTAGVDEVFTVHNHSVAVQRLFTTVFGGRFTNFRPEKLYARYLRESGIVDPRRLVLCAPDKGALDFVQATAEAIGGRVPVLIMDKARTGERQVSTRVSASSPCQLADIRDKDVIVMDDMVRTGNTILKCCALLREHGPSRIVFMVTHFHFSEEGKLNLSSPVIDEVITTNTIPAILNRDIQGRLRKKIAVIKLARWLSHHLRVRFGLAEGDPVGKWYQEDLSSKNPRSAL